MPQRDHRRGLTLIEILIVVAILGIFMSALLYFVFPSDERRCELEAKRLAAYLTSTGAESAMRDGAARVAFDIGASKGEREVTKIGADITRDLWERDKKGGTHEVRAPVQIDTVDTPAVPEMKAGMAYVLFRNGKCPQGAVVILGIGEVFYSVVVPSTGGEIRVERGRAGKPTSGTDGQKPSRKNKGRSGKSTTSTPPDYSSSSLGSVPGYTPPASSRSGGGSGSGSTKPKPKPPSRDNTGSDDVPDYPTPDDTPLPKIPSVDADDLKTPKPPEKPPTDDTGVCTNGQTQCVGQSAQQVCANGQWGAATSCAPGQMCSGGRCGASNLGNPNVEATNHLLTSVTVTKPSNVNNLLQSLINNALESGQINWIIHRKAGTNPSDTLGFWLVQAQRRENTAGTEYELKPDVPTYALQDKDPCDFDTELPDIPGLPEIDGLPVTGRCFETQREDSTLGLYIPDNNAEEGVCQYFFIELLFVTVELDYNNDREMTVEGTLSLRSARELEVEGLSVKDKLEELNVPMDGDLTEDGVPDSWIIRFTGRSQSAIFTDDPANRDDPPPGCL